MIITNMSFSQLESNTPLKTQKQNTIYKVGWLFEENTPPPQTSQDCVYLTGRFSKGTDFMTCDKSVKNPYINRVR